ncbi:hypothetical protein DUNSADRAFT_17162 [Dunaliella salina]|uniref:Encoded protein n=1 Tax=Dunaliella salina TaxID=3046 RepID=A0ABQ7H0D5_DUNSA|nr:hypothetical protein DUNSADRAFT_17162 [Dunaliella salina]|eukprot:KAF5840318.1 hypothetical protein DUNSADRAFT_17162 [Dunaliella salina]
MCAGCYPAQNFTFVNPFSANNPFCVRMASKGRQSALQLCSPFSVSSSHGKCRLLHCSALSHEKHQTKRQGQPLSTGPRFSMRFRVNAG